MTDRIRGFVVTLETDMRDDDCEPIAEAIRQLRGVASVRGKATDLKDHMATMQVRNLLAKQLWQIVEDLK